jgi:hypothetical protein
MAGFANVREYIDAIRGGRETFSTIRKIPSQASTAGQWVDLSMAAGQPIPNYYASDPLTAATLSKYRGIYHGDDKSPDYKFLTEIALATPTAAMVGRYMLLDYVLYYPFIDMDSLDVQTMDNAVTLPRYETGDGLMAIGVAVAPTIGSGSFTFEYVNQSGVTKTSPTQLCGTSVANIASFVTSQPATVAGVGPFLKLADGDTGIRQINSVTMLGSNGGLMALVLVRPITDIPILEINTVREVSMVHFKPGPPRVYDGAYLGLICCTAGSVAAGTLAGHARFTWK